MEEATNLILNTAELSLGGEIFILKMPTFNILNIAKNINKKYNRDENNIIFTGLKKGEKLHEELITKEELRLAVENEKIIIILPQELIPHYESIGFKKVI